MRPHPKLTVIAALLGAAITAGCAISPEASQQLEQARAVYRSAAADPAVQANAQAELQSAAGALQDAERMAAAGEPNELIEHNAYLAEQRSRIALRSAEMRAAEASIAASGEERRRLQLEAREREAAAAREQATAAREQARQAEEARKEAESRAAILENERLEKEKQVTAAAELGAEVKRLESELADVRAKQTERGWILTLKNELLFDSGGSTLKPGAQRALDNLAQFLQKYSDRDIAIEGFTDSTGSKDLNQQLSEKRAWAVKAALVARGISSTRIDARGYGPSFPVAGNDTPTGRQLNRRVEIVINPS
jgi:outer membrane protein OmpA-like peptidoglycan-associated protein